MNASVVPRHTIHFGDFEADLSRENCLKIKLTG